MLLGRTVWKLGLWHFLSILRRNDLTKKNSTSKLKTGCTIFCLFFYYQLVIGAYVDIDNLFPFPLKKTALYKISSPFWQ